MGKILCYIYEGMADFEISLLLHRLRNTGKHEIIAISESIVDFTEAVCDYLHIFETENQKYEQLGRIKEA